MTQVWVALDVHERPECERLLKAIWPHRHVKVGLELFMSQGPSYVVELVDRGYEVFLDLKLHDIPRTVANACYALSTTGVKMLTVHTAGGVDMLDQARQAAGSIELIGVTVLTSLDDGLIESLGVAASAHDWSRILARQAMNAGISGLVASGREVAMLHQLWPGARLVVPGIRLDGDPLDDQKRVVTPAQAKAEGATDLVIGRSITQHENPGARLEAVLLSLGGEEGMIK